MILAMKLFPSILAKESIKAREYLAQAFYQYFRAGHHEEGSGLVQARWNHSKEHKIADDRDIARFEIGGAFAVLSNTIPTAFWTLFHIFSDPVVLEDCRREVNAVMREQDGICTVDIDDVKTSCPILLSTFQEVLRFHGVNVATRLVVEDCYLNDQYLLKKDSLVMIPGPVQHFDTSVWGNTTGSFDHKRFVRTAGAKRPNPAAFRAFGGGHVLCPGRHFATTEVLAMVAMTVTRFDIRPTSGDWITPTSNNSPMSAAVAVPDNDILCNIVPRSNKQWRFIVSRSNKTIGIVAEDINAGEGEKLP
jgi:cytochrome P450